MPARYYNADIALRPRWDQRPSTVPSDEYLPSELLVGGIYGFRKSGHRNFKSGSVVTLFEICQTEVFFRYRALVRIVEAAFTSEGGRSYTVGKYKVESLLQEGSEAQVS